MQKGRPKKTLRQTKHQQRPGSEATMQPQPVFDYPERTGNSKLKNKVALITGGDSGIGRAVAVLFAKEGADIAIAYLNEHQDAKDTRSIVRDLYQRECELIPGDISNERHCETVIKKTIAKFGKIDILINNAALHFENEDFTGLTSRELKKTFDTNILSFFWITKAALRFMKRNSCIINSSSVTAYRGSGSLIDYAATKGAIVSFTRSLSANLAKKGIRVNGVAPGPIWTPLITSSFPAKKAAKHGSDVPLGRAGQPVEIAPCYLFLACDDSSYMTGQFLHPNGGEIVNG